MEHVAFPGVSDSCATTGVFASTSMGRTHNLARLSGQPSWDRRCWTAARILRARNLYRRDLESLSLAGVANPDHTHNTHHPTPGRPPAQNSRDALAALRRPMKIKIFHYA